MTKYSFDDVFQNMRLAYSEQGGKLPEEDTKDYRILQSVASELFSLSSYGDFILKQAFVQSASGEYLDRHASLRDTERKQGAVATGRLTFVLESERDFGVSIPQGTICSCSGRPLIQFVTTEQCNVDENQQSVTVNARAIDVGRKYNAMKNTVDTLVDAPAGVIAVYNSDAFIGGKDIENDTHLRRRLLNSYNVLQNGINARSLENAVMKIPTIRDCKIQGVNNFGTLSVIVEANNDSLTAQEVEAIENALAVIELMDIECDISVATPKRFSLTVDIYAQNGYENDFDTQEITQMLEELCLSCRISEPIEFTKIARTLCRLDGVIDVSINSNEAYGNAVYCDYNEYPCVDEVIVNVYGTQF